LFRNIPFIGLLFWPFEILALPRIMSTKGARLRKLLVSLGPTFIKFGQLLSTRPDLVGEQIADELSLLQDELPSFSFRKVEKIIKQETGKNVLDLFKEFIPEPVAAASIAQVHKAITQDDKVVAVKILRPGIRRKFNREISLLYMLASFVNCFSRLRRLRLKEVVRMFDNTVRQELNLRLEAAGAHKLAENLKSNNNIVIPGVYWSLTSNRVLVSDWLEGTKITKLKGRSKKELKEIGDNLVICYYEQAYRDGYFHADLHPGNILITKDNKIGLIDFGIMGSLSQADRLSVAQIVHGFIKRDYDYVAKIHKTAGYIPRDTNLDEFSLACRSIGEPIFGQNAQDISIAKLLAQLFLITESFGMQTQPQLLLLQKTLILIEGVGAQLNPELNMWALGEPWMKDWAKENLSAKAIAKYKLEEARDLICELPLMFQNAKELLETLNEAGRKKSNKKGACFFTYGIVCGMTAMLLILL